uniref:Pinoresinol-lariciresinol reductase n=1 Tax=Isatis tinctoria TaxID=161756 RepID=I6LRS1_ISATI|nr:Chain A, Pinoresinol-lariciresinol reductase [Isatis tinctoria]7CS2_B Chain B, Pinoresinol-lariciresinol reductase [Isatis tinctoria]7CS2_C Chain C, Pinoresinol-lariciresinol reductase [Isatis tinctoria]7CS2_D Chain D, Pinoresinol-lariciresinol reductase [Isatis tinctoria]7CS2_E Chain E, Pinoresinol-lariciresinol reductase [Isatis tinctoria]7CS2_F Chain F, Pinoresinol-lariciresinol reductase [Isatis tinctoria]7CS3_A Chain A, Pinoresinol-lariciresinol reductase [Isatis tinctoria]7CS3_B Cha
MRENNSGEKTRVLVVGGTGTMGRRIVRACLAEGHETYVLQQPETRVDIEKVQLLYSYKRLGARLIEASFSDHQSLVSAVKQVDIVVAAMSGVHFRSHSILVQLKLVEAIKEAGNIKRFLPSEFGMDPSRMGHAMPPGRETFDQKLEVRNAIEAAGIPHTYVVGACFAAYFAGNLSQMGTLIPPKKKVNIYGDGNVKVVYVDEDDIAEYTAKTLDDPRTINKTVYVRPTENVLTQMELVQIWEKLTGKELEKTNISANDFLADIEDKEIPHQAGLGHFYHIFYEGCLTDHEVGDDEEASKLYPDVKYTRMDEYLKIFL